MSAWPLQMRVLLVGAAAELGLAQEVWPSPYDEVTFSETISLTLRQLLQVGARKGCGEERAMDPTRERQLLLDTLLCKVLGECGASVEVLRFVLQATPRVAAWALSPRRGLVVMLVVLLLSPYCYSNLKAIPLRCSHPSSKVGKGVCESRGARSPDRLFVLLQMHSALMVGRGGVGACVLRRQQCVS